MEVDKLVGVAVLHQVSAHAIENYFRRAAVSSANHGFAAGHGFEVYEAKTFGRGWAARKFRKQSSTRRVESRRVR